MTPSSDQFWKDVVAGGLGIGKLENGYSPHLGSVLPSTQFSVNLVRGEGFRCKILTSPLNDVIVLWVTGVLKYFEKLSKTVWSSAVFWRTISLSRHTNLLERIVSEQNLLKKKLVLPAVAKIVLV